MLEKARGEEVGQPFDRQAVDDDVARIVVEHETIPAARAGHELRLAGYEDEVLEGLLDLDALYLKPR